jgi:predicted AAA+ superfamily ATPase
LVKRQVGRVKTGRALGLRAGAGLPVPRRISTSKTLSTSPGLEAPRQALGPLEGLVVLDEIQRRPELFPLLRVLADREGRPARFLVLGSASLDLVKGVSESLAGRVGFVDLSGFDATEVGVDRLDALWLRGGFPSGKRVRKAAKIFLRDSGIFHALLRVGSRAELRAHPKLGASWEGMALEHVLRVLRAEPGEAFSWATDGGAGASCEGLQP